MLNGYIDTLCDIKVRIFLTCHSDGKSNLFIGGRRFAERSVNITSERVYFDDIGIRACNRKFIIPIVPIFAVIDSGEFALCNDIFRDNELNIVINGGSIKFFLACHIGKFIGSIARQNSVHLIKRLIEFGVGKRSNCDCISSSYRNFC